MVYTAVAFNEHPSVVILQLLDANPNNSIQQQQQQRLDMRDEREGSKCVYN